ncbi:hypothetical protein GCM10010286_17930 [Streptomyces toxytricini]|nr:hypothetical protein GCM10010286_17930 [Streptomyces toxytricini]
MHARRPRVGSSASVHTRFQPPHHCLTAQTTPHPAEQPTGGRGFLTGTLGTLPEGLHVLHAAKARGGVVEIPDFIGQTERW